MKMKNMLLETEGKVILIKEAKNLSEMCPSVVWKVEVKVINLDI